MEAEAENKNTRGKKKHQQQTEIEGLGRCAGSCIFTFHGSNDETRKEACFFGAWLFPCLPRIPFHSNWFKKGNNHPHPRSAALSFSRAEGGASAGRQEEGISPALSPRNDGRDTGLGGKEANQRGQETDRGTGQPVCLLSTRGCATPALLSLVLHGTCCKAFVQGRVPQAERCGTMRKEQRVLACGRICARPGIHRGVANFRGPQASPCLSSNPTLASASAAPRNIDTASQRLLQSSISGVYCLVTCRRTFFIVVKTRRAIGDGKQIVCGRPRRIAPMQFRTSYLCSASNEITDPFPARRQR